MIAFELFPTVIAGCRVAHGAERHGRMGLIAVSGQREILGLTVSTIIADGETATIDAAGKRAFLGPGRRLTGEGTPDSPISCLICAIPLVGPIRLRSEFAGLEAAQYPQSPIPNRESVYLLRGDERVALGELVAIGATVYRGLGEQRLVYYGAIEVAIEPGTLQDGDAGSAVILANGSPIGLLVGEADGFAIVAPLAPVFRTARLAPLTPLEAARHFGSVIQQNERQFFAHLLEEEQQPRFDPQLMASNLPPIKSSEELLASSDLLKAVA